MRPYAPFAEILCLPPLRTAPLRKPPAAMVNINNGRIQTAGTWATESDRGKSREASWTVPRTQYSPVPFIPMPVSGEGAQPAWHRRRMIGRGSIFPLQTERTREREGVFGAVGDLLDKVRRPQRGLVDQFAGSRDISRFGVAPRGFEGCHQSPQYQDGRA